MGETAAQADQIIANARAQLEALAAGVGIPQKQKLGASTGLLVAGAVTAGGAVTLGNEKSFDEEQAGNITDAISGDADAGNAGADGGGAES